MTIVYAVAVLGVLAIVFGLILAVAAKVFEVEVDPVCLRSRHVWPAPTAAAAATRLRRLRRGHPGR